MKRHLIPGGRDRHGIARPTSPECWYSHDVGHFHRETEMESDVAPDAKRVIQPPVRTPEDADHIARVRRWALFLAVVTFSALAALLGISDPRFTP